MFWHEYLAYKGTVTLQISDTYLEGSPMNLTARPKIPTCSSFSKVMVVVISFQTQYFHYIDIFQPYVGIYCYFKKLLLVRGILFFKTITLLKINK